MNTDEWLHVDLKPIQNTRRVARRIVLHLISKDSVKGQRYVGPGGEKMYNLGELKVEVRTEQHAGSEISSQVTFQGAKVRKPSLAVSGVIGKGNIVVFDGRGSFLFARPMCNCGFCKRGCHRGSGTHPVTREKWCVCLADLGT